MYRVLPRKMRHVHDTAAQDIRRTSQGRTMSSTMSCRPQYIEHHAERQSATEPGDSSHGTSFPTVSIGWFRTLTTSSRMAGPNEHVRVSFRQPKSARYSSEAAAIRHVQPVPARKNHFDNPLAPQHDTYMARMHDGKQDRTRIPEPAEDSGIISSILKLDCFLHCMQKGWHRPRLLGKVFPLLGFGVSQEFGGFKTV